MRKMKGKWERRKKEETLMHEIHEQFIHQINFRKEKKASLSHAPLATPYYIYIHTN